MQAKDFKNRFSILEILKVQDILLVVLCWSKLNIGLLILLFSFHFFYISVFAKMQFFKISEILCFSVGLLFFSFFLFSPAKFSQPPLDRFAPNLARICLPALGRKWRGRFLKSSKTRSQRPKDIKNRSIFHTHRHVFARCDEMVKDFWKNLFCDDT